MDFDQNRRMHESVLGAVGRTPLVRLRRVADGFLALKLEWFGASGSLKDRIYLRMIEAAERSGALRPGMTLLECSTGNAGAACAMIAAVKGYPCTVVMPAGMSEERKRLIAAYGATLELTPGGESDVDLSLQRLEALRRAAPERYFVPAQFSNPENPNAHEQTTGPEIWEQTEGRVDAFIASQGTGGCVTGVGRFLRKQNPNVQLWVVEPEECAILAEGRWGPHGIEGIGDGFIPENLDCGPLTGVVTTTTAESIQIAQRLAREEGLFCGISSGCNVAAALRLKAAHPELGCVVTLANDTGQRYFSTALCGAEKQVEVPEREHRLDARTTALLARHRPGWEILRPSR